MMSHGDRERFDMFKDMPEEQKQKVRAAFEKAWKKPEVTEARERLMKANEEYRKILHKALAEADPEVAKILENTKPPMGQGGAGMPDINDTEFASKALQRLQPPKLANGRESPMSRMHDKVMRMPAVAEAIKKLQQAEPAQRMEAWARLREVYQATTKSEFGKNLDNLRKDGPLRSPQDQKAGTEPSDEPRKP